MISGQTIVYLEVNNTHSGNFVVADNLLNEFYIRLAKLEKILQASNFVFSIRVKTYPYNESILNSNSIYSEILDFEQLNRTTFKLQYSISNRGAGVLFNSFQTEVSRHNPLVSAYTKDSMYAHIEILLNLSHLDGLQQILDAILTNVPTFLNLDLQLSDTTNLLTNMFKGFFTQGK